MKTSSPHDQTAMTTYANHGKWEVPDAESRLGGGGGTGGRQIAMAVAEAVAGAGAGAGAVAVAVAVAVMHDGSRAGCSIIQSRPCFSQSTVIQ